MLMDWKRRSENEALADIGKTRRSQPSGELQDKWVNYEYPIKLGLIKQLEAEGYKLKWESANNEATAIDIDGWEYALVEGPDGPSRRLKIHDDQVIGGHLVTQEAIGWFVARPIYKGTLRFLDD